MHGSLEGSGLLDLAEKNADECGLGGESGLESDGFSDLRDGGATRLFGGFERNATPTVEALRGGLGQVLLGATGKDRGDSLDTKLGRFFDCPLEVIELEDSEQEMEWEGGLSLELFVEGEGDTVGGDGDDLGAVEEAAGNEIEDLSGFGAENAGEVGGLIAGEGGDVVIAVPGVGDKAAASHGDSLGGFGQRLGWLVVEKQIPTG